MGRVNIRIGPLLFDRADYDAENDVLYLHAGEPQKGEGEETLEDTSSATDCSLTLSILAAPPSNCSGRLRGRVGPGRLCRGGCLRTASPHDVPYSVWRRCQAG